MTPSIFVAVFALLGIAGMTSLAAMLAKRSLPEPERPDAPHPLPLRRRRTDGPDTLFLDTPEFRRRITSGWHTDDRERVLR